MEPKTLANRSFLEGLARPASNRVVVLLSGGVDSAAVAAMLKESGVDVLPLFVDYGQVALAAERAAALKLTAALGLRSLRIIDCDLFERSAGLRPAPAQDDTAAWLPARNTLFMLYAGIYAFSVDADGIALGYMLDDNFVFGDNDYFHHRLLELLLERSLLRPFSVLMPARGYDKRQLMAYLVGRNLLDLTVSCWNAGLAGDRIIECGSCANCLEKRAATGQGATAWRLLAVAAHADDEALLCGGTLHKAAQRGHEMHVLLCTRNEQGRSGEESIEARRSRAEAEASRAAALLGCETSFLGDEFADMRLGERPGALCLALIEAVRRLQPEVLITHAAQDWHSDHRAVAAAVSEAAFQAGCRVAGASTPWRPRAVLGGEVDIEGLAALPFAVVSRLEMADYEARQRALEVYATVPSEHETDEALMYESLRARAVSRGALIDAPFGEAFLIDRQVTLDGAALRLLAELLE